MSSACKPETTDQKRRLQHFQSELAILGSLQGFRYFQPWLRGKEELLLTIVNEDQDCQSPGFPVSAASSSSSSMGDSSSSYSFGSDYDSSPLPGEKPTLRGDAAARTRQQQQQQQQQQQHRDVEKKLHQQQQQEQQEKTRHSHMAKIEQRHCK